MASLVLSAGAMTMRSLLIALPILSLTACGADPGEVADEGTELSADDDAKADRGSSSLYYSVRHDTRRCVFPICGGYWVKKVNSTADEVYVPEIDLARTGLGADDNVVLGGSVVRGKLAQKTYDTFGSKPILAAESVWALATGSTPSGTTYMLTDEGRVCFRAPCFNIAEDKLNWTTATRQLSDVRGPLANSALASLRGDDQIIVSGTNRSGARGAKEVAITAYWTRVARRAVPSCATLTCGAGMACEMIQVTCITTPCDAVPTCVMTDEHLVELAKTYAFGHNDASYTKRFFDTEAAAYAAATTTPSLLWAALDGARNKFVWGYNDLWAERFEIDRITGDLRVTGEH